jgi:hypothetical protein
MISSQRANLMSLEQKYIDLELDQLDALISEAEILESKALK